MKRTVLLLSLIMGFVSCSENARKDFLSSNKDVTFDEVKKKSENVDPSIKKNFDKMIKDEGSGNSSDNAIASTNSNSEVSFSLETKSACHVGDIDIILPALKEEASDFLVTLETNDGNKLFSKNIDITDILVRDQLNLVNKLKKTKFTAKVKTPKGVKEGDVFRVNYFACVDSNKNNSCADEKIISTEGFKPQWLTDPSIKKTDVIYYKSLFAYVKNNKLYFTDVKDIESNSVYKDLQGKTSNAQAHDKSPLSFQLVKATSDQKCLSSSGGKDSGSMTDSSNANQDDTIVDNIVEEKEEEDPFANNKHVNSARNAPAKAILGTLFGRKAANALLAARGYGGCFVEGTMIRMANGKDLPIEIVRPGAKVMRSNGTTAMITKMVAGPEKIPVYYLKTQDGREVGVTEGHPMVTLTGIKKAKDLNEWDLLLVEKNNWTGIESIAQRKYDRLVYNFVVEGKTTNDHIIVANGIMTGDLYIQKQLLKKSKDKMFVAKK